MHVSLGKGPDARHVGLKFPSEPRAPDDLPAVVWRNDKGLGQQDRCRSAAGVVLQLLQRYRRTKGP